LAPRQNLVLEIGHQHGVLVCATKPAKLSQPGNLLA
jgi:hypothetical protein